MPGGRFCGDSFSGVSVWDCGKLDSLEKRRVICAMKEYLNSGESAAF